MQAICKKYMYNHVYNATLLQDIMKELAGADGVRELKDAPAPNALSTKQKQEPIFGQQHHPGRG
jgi:hypothetical protein